TETELKSHIEKLVRAANWSKWKQQIGLLLRHHDVHDIICGDRKCPSLTAEVSAEAIGAYEKAQKAFVKDDFLAQLITVGNMVDSNAELALFCNTAESVWEKMLSVYEQFREKARSFDGEVFSQLKRTGGSKPYCKAARRL
ncbi:uncharacterized protein TNCT_623921, partial [Trichonephila clavata]